MKDCDTLRYRQFYQAGGGCALRPGGGRNFVGKGMQAKSSLAVTARTLGAVKDQAKGAGAVAALLFSAALGCAFWVGAVFASTPWPH